jgi:Domain of unknown function (DUF4262)
MLITEHKMEKASVEAFLRNAAAQIAANELMIMNVENLNYSFTIGHTPAVPELIISGFDTKLRMAVLGHLAGPFRERHPNSTIKYNGRNFAFRDVGEAKARELADMAFLFYRDTQHTVRLSQIVYPDFCGKFPWDKHVHPSLDMLQASFWKS